MNSVPLKILVVEDDVFFRESLCQLLELKCRIDIIQTAGDVEEGRRLLEAGDLFDVFILDFRLPVSGGGQDIDTSLCRRAKHKFPNSLVIHVTAYENHPEAVRHINEMHAPISIVPGYDPVDTQHLGLTISKGFAVGADVDDPEEASRCAREIIDAVTRRGVLMTIEAQLDGLLGGGGFRLQGITQMYGIGMIGHLECLTLALEDAWIWLPELTKQRARKLFTVREMGGSPDRVHIQLL